MLRTTATTALTALLLASACEDRPAADPSSANGTATTSAPTAGTNAAPAPTGASPSPAADPTSAAAMRGKLPGCTGTTSDELQQALLKRASEARHCYSAYITNNTPVRVKMNVSTRVFLNGDVGKVELSSRPSDPTMTECMVKEFEKGGFPAPSGNGCVDVHVPIEFDPQP